MEIRGLFMEIRVYKRETNLSQILNKSILYTNYQKCVTNYHELVTNYRKLQLINEEKVLQIEKRIIFAT